MSVKFKGPNCIREQAENEWNGDNKSSVYSLDMTQGVLGGLLLKNDNSLFFLKSFANVTVVDVGSSLLLIDTGSSFYAADLHAVIRSQFSKDKPVTHAVYTHRHVDHVGGLYIFDLENKKKGIPPVNVIGHVNIRHGFDRYKLTNGYNAIINQRQFGTPKPQFNSSFHYPDTEYATELKQKIGKFNFEFYHARGETDDATWVFLDAGNNERVVFGGDFLIWAFPNCGNPQKVQRYPIEWASALRAMEAKKPTILVPGHGSPVFGIDRCRAMLLDTATALEDLFKRTIDLINAGKSLNYIVHNVSLPSNVVDKPYLRAIYDEPQFVVNNLWRLYAGWYDQNPSHLKPPKDADLAHEITEACGCEKLLGRAQQLAETGSYDVACSLVEFAHQANPVNSTVTNARADIYLRRSNVETSLMAKNIYKSISREVKGEDDADRVLVRFFADKLDENKTYIVSRL